MKKISLLIFFLCLFSGITFSQSSEIDSLKQLLAASERQDTTRVINLVALSNAYCYFNTDTFMLLSIQANSLARKINFIRGEIASLTNIGVAYSMLGNYPKALEAALKTLEMCENTNDKKRTFNALTNIGYIYTELGDYIKALDYIQRSKSAAAEIHDESSMAMAYTNLGDIYLSSEQLDSALLYTQQSYELCIRLNLEDLTGIALNNMGSIYALRGETGYAMDYYRQCIPYYQKNNDDEGMSILYFGMAETLKKTGETDSSLYYARLSLQIAQKTGLTSRVMTAGIFLTDFFKEIKSYDSAFIYQELVIAAKDSLFSQEKMRQVENLTMNEIVRQQEIVEAKAKEEEERKNNLQLMGIAAFIVLFVLFVMMLIRKKIKPRLVEILGVIALLLVFEFIALFLHPHIAEWTYHTPVYMLLILVGVAALLSPLHHRMEKWVKSKLSSNAHNIKSTSKAVSGKEKN